MRSVRLKVNGRIEVCGAFTESQEEQLRACFEHDNPKYSKLMALGFRWQAKKEPKTIRTWARTDEGMITVPRGGCSRVLEWCKDEGFAVDVEDETLLGDPAYAGQIPKHRVEMRDYQVRLVDAGASGRTGVLRAPTGSGKTTVLFALAAKLNLPTIVIVHNTKLLEQWVVRAQKELGLKKDDVGIVQGKTRRIRPLTIAMQKTVAMGAGRELAKVFGVVLCDEAHLWAARTFVDAVDPFEAKYRLAVSADERRKDRKEFLVYDMFGQVLAEVERSELVDDGHVLDVEIRVVPTDFRADWYADREKPKPGDEVRLAKEISEDEGRVELARKIIKEESEGGEQVLVMAQRREHCRSIGWTLSSCGVDHGFLIGGDDYRSEFDETLAALESGKQRVAVGTIQAVGTGIDLPSVAVAVVVSPVAGNKGLLGQVRGRVCRPAEGKSGARMYYLWDQHVHGVKHLKNLARWNKRVLVCDAANGGWVDAKAYLRRVS